MTTYLEDLRRKSGLTIQQVLDKARDVAPDIAPSTRAGIIHWEQQGILNVRVIQALSLIYDCPLAEITDAATASKKRYHDRRKHQKKVTKEVTFA